MAKELSKAEFKKMYMHHRTDGDGWTDDYWDHFFEKKTGKRYFYEKPKTAEHKRMFVNQSIESVSLYFMTLDSEESFFDYPGKE